MNVRPPGHNVLGSSSSSSSSSTARPPRLSMPHATLQTGMHSHPNVKRSILTSYSTPLGLPAASRRVPAAAASSSSSSNARTSKGSNPDLDELELDESYYEEIGMTREQAMQQQRDMMFSLDPEAVTLDDLASVDGTALPEEWRKAIENLQVYGPQVRAGSIIAEHIGAANAVSNAGALGAWVWHVCSKHALACKHNAAQRSRHQTPLAECASANVCAACAPAAVLCWRPCHCNWRLACMLHTCRH
jgi:hypothetical protein